MKLFMKTDIGLVRQTNQDAVVGMVLDKHTAWAAVCDGMGGANGGNIASETCAKILTEQMENGIRPDMAESSVRNLLSSSVYNANHAVYSIAEKDASLKGMGTTAVLALAEKDKAYLVNIGDSRAFLVREGIEQLTKDHTIVQAMVDLGELTEEQAREHPQKHIITRALGVNASVDVDFYTCEFPENAILLLCSDGLSNHVEAEEILSLCRQIPLEELAESLVTRAIESGGSDNVTVAVIANQPQEAS